MGRTAKAKLGNKSIEVHDKNCSATGATDVQGLEDGKGKTWDIGAVRLLLTAIANQAEPRAVFCHAGLNRSATFAILFLWLAGGDDTTLWDAFKAVRDGYEPGHHMSEELVKGNLSQILITIGAVDIQGRRESFEDWTKRVKRNVAVANLLPIQ